MTRQPYRLTGGGRVDRDRPLTFSFDGTVYGGYAGDTLASALLANGVHLVGRSFKYHRPRGILSAGTEEPNALVRVGGKRDRSEPNLRATEVELYDGLVAESQNRWPSLRNDLGAVSDLMSPLLAAGFYYKTFMSPAWMWRHYERLIRRAAGMGRAPTAPDPDRYDHVNAHCDLLVVGGGPAGLSAALAAGRAGARVILADEQAEFGGTLLSEPQDGLLIDDLSSGEWVADTLRGLAALDCVRLLPRATVFGYYHDNLLCVLERVTDHIVPRDRPEGLPRQRLWKVRAKHVVLATGAIERPLVFPDNDRPGIMLAGAVRTYLNRYAVKAGERAVIFTNNDSAYSVALELNAAGVDVPAIVDLRASTDEFWPQRAREAGIRVLAGCSVAATAGRRRIRHVDAMRLAADGRDLVGEPERLSCDLLCISGGWNPAVHLHQQAGGRITYRPETGTFVPDVAVQPVRSAGACNGTFGLDRCLAEGHAAAGSVQDAVGSVPPATAAAANAEAAAPRLLWRLPGKGRDGKSFVDLQNDVCASDLELAVREGYRSVEHVKRYTTTGMGTDQGKTGNINALGIVAETLGVDIPDVGVTTFRPPYTPVTIGAIAGRQVGAFLSPGRYTPMHQWHVRHGAEFENVGEWKRAWYYPKTGESMRFAVARETRAARASVAMLDYSTLGKIDVRGHDAGAFLDRIYTHACTRLEINRCRYGLILGEDGMVMDDGITARLGENHYYLTTTTTGAATVMNWLEEWLQTEWYHLNVHLTSVTEQWAVVSLCGPDSRRLLGELSDDLDLRTEAFPFMSVREGHVADVPARVFRVSFTGELSYEINVPASWGLAVWEAIWQAGQKYGVTPYGTEAMHVLRAEKGFFIVGQETDGTVSPIDLGMDRGIGKRTTDFIGRRSLAFPELRRPDRRKLVGLLTADPEEVLEEGVHLISNPIVPAPPVRALGHVTSSYFSPNAGRSIALAMVEGGASRQGETVFAVAGARTIAATVTSPVFVDPEGSRLHA